MDETTRVVKKGDVLVPMECMDGGNYLVFKDDRAVEAPILSGTQVEVMIPNEQLRLKLSVYPELRLVDAYFDLYPLDVEEDEELSEVFRCYQTDKLLFTVDALECGIEVVVLKTPDFNELPEPVRIRGRGDGEEMEEYTVTDAVAVAAASGGGPPPWWKQPWEAE
jgi:hypothetical protein